MKEVGKWFKKKKKTYPKGSQEKLQMNALISITQNLVEQFVHV